jgi:hypothetical protein
VPVVTGAVVASVIVIVAGLPAVTFTELGKVQVGAGVTDGLTPQARFTVPLQVGDVTSSLNMALVPAVTVALVCEPEADPMVKFVAACTVKTTPVPC